MIRKFYDMYTGGSTGAYKDVDGDWVEFPKYLTPPPSGIEELQQDFKELSLYLDQLCINGHEVKDAGNLWIAFTDKFNAFRKKIIAGASYPKEEWFDVSKGEFPEEGTRIEVFSPEYPENNPMRHRIIDEQFLKISKDATHWRKLTDPIVNQ